MFNGNKNIHFTTSILILLLLSSIFTIISKYVENLFPFHKKYCGINYSDNDLCPTNNILFVRFIHYFVAFYFIFYYFIFSKNYDLFYIILYVLLIFHWIVSNKCALSEWEMNYDGDDTILCEIGAYYYDTENYRGIDEKHTLRLYGLVNLESPYHRRGNLDDSYDIDITFDSISELKEKVDAGLKEIIEWFDGKYYNDSDAEMKIRRMANGGAFAPNVSNGTEFMSGVYADGGFMNDVYANGGEVLPPSKIYGENIHKAMMKFNISDSEARNT